MTVYHHVGDSKDAPSFLLSNTAQYDGSVEVSQPYNGTQLLPMTRAAYMMMWLMTRILKYVVLLLHLRCRRTRVCRPPSQSHITSCRIL